MLKEPIKIWKFEDAPEQLRERSTNGGDEDWVALIPPYLKDEWLGFLESGTSFGCCDVDEILIPAGKYKGYELRIGSHS